MSQLAFLAGREAIFQAEEVKDLYR